MVVKELSTTETCCQFPKMKLWSTDSSMEQRQTLQQQLATTPPQHHHHHFYINYATLTVLRQVSTANKGYL